jgi:hypothetical protein
MIADVNMLVQVGGRERTAPEFGALLERADLRLVRVVPTGTLFNLLEAVPALSISDRIDLESIQP